MHVVRVREKLARYVPSGRARLRHETNDLRLSLVHRAKITMKKLLEIRHHITVSAMYERRRETTQAREADEIFRERVKAFRRVNRIGRQDRIRRDALQDAIARDDRAVCFTKE